MPSHFRRDSHAASGYPIKLVRDDIGQRLGGEGTITYERLADRAEHVRLLRKKLIEEAAEYAVEPSVGELSDVLAVVWALARVDLEITPADVENAMKVKLYERGGFERGMVMVGHHAADGRGLLPSDVPCGRLLVGRGDDTYDPPCALAKGHNGRCLTEEEARDAA